MVSFQPGDQVQLREGGAPMMVTNDNKDGSVICFWFSQKEDQLVWRSFPTEQLEHTKSAASPEDYPSSPRGTARGQQRGTTHSAARR